MRIANRGENAVFMMVKPPSWAITSDCLRCEVLEPGPALHSDLFLLIHQRRKCLKMDASVLARYKAGYRRQLWDAAKAGHLAPGVLEGTRFASRERVVLTDAHTLVCTCAKAEAKEDRCHRCWVAAALRYVGWRVETDFEEEG